MKKNNKWLIIFSLMIPILISVGFAAWIITYEVIFIPEEIEVVNDLTDKFPNNVEYTYDANPHSVEPLDKNYDISNLVFEYKKNGTKLNDEPINAGVYEVTIYKKEDPKCFKIVDMKINKAIPIIVDNPIIPAFIEGEEVTKSGGSAVGVKNDNLEGNFSFFDGGTKTIEYIGNNPTSTESTVKMKFTPDDTTNYEEKIFEFNVTMKAVAYIKETGYYYGTIEKALDSAVSNQTVVVRLHSELGTNPVIRKSCTIKLNVTLCIPFEGITWDGRQTSTDYLDCGGQFADATINLIDKYKQSEVEVCENVVIINNGTIQIGGILGHEGQGLSGHTSGKYAQITMDKNAKIESNGDIWCFGYIKESSKDNGSKILSNSGNIYMPFVIHDYRGGSSTVGAYAGTGSLLGAGSRKGNISPFNVFSLPNIQIKLITYYRSNIIGCADLYTDKLEVIFITIKAQHNTTNINIIGNNNSIINIKTGGRLEIKYHANTFDEKTNVRLTNEDLDKVNLNLYGGAFMGSLSMNIEVGISVKITTADVLFPISWIYDVNLYDGEYEIRYKTKFLTGSSLKVNDDAILVTNADIIFYQEFNDTSKVGKTYPVKEAAKCIINGKLIINNPFGGCIETESKKDVESLVTINNNTSVISDEGYGTRNGLNVEFQSIFKPPIELSVTGKQENTLNSPSNFNVGVYMSHKQTDFWSAIAEEDYFQYKIIFHSNNVDAKFSNGTEELIKNYLSTEPVVISSLNVEVPVREYYDFIGWYLDETCTQSVEGYKIENSIELNLYAKWEKHQYGIFYNVVNKDIDTIISDINLSPKTFTYDDKIKFSRYNLDEYSFYGWYLDEEYKVLLDLNKEYTGEELISLITNNILMVYGYITKEKTYNIYFDFGLFTKDEIFDPIMDIKEGYKISSDSINYSRLQDFITNIGINTLREDINASHYWSGRLYYLKNGENKYFESIDSILITSNCFDEGTTTLTLYPEDTAKSYIKFYRTETMLLRTIYFINTYQCKIENDNRNDEEKSYNGDNNKRYWENYIFKNWKDKSNKEYIADTEYNFASGNYDLYAIYETKYYVMINVEIQNTGRSSIEAKINNQSYSNGNKIQISIDKPGESTININVSKAGSKTTLTITYLGDILYSKKEYMHSYNGNVLAFNGSIVCIAS